MPEDIASYADLGYDANVQAAVEHALLDFIGRDHADIDVHIRATFFQMGKRVGDAHMGEGDQIVRIWWWRILTLRIRWFAIHQFNL